jgi:hypothetical protein
MRSFAACSLNQGFNIPFFKLHPRPTLETAWEHHGAVTNSDQTANRMTNCLKHAADLTVSTFRNGDAVPAIGAFAPAGFNRTKVGHAIVKLDTIQ